MFSHLLNEVFNGLPQKLFLAVLLLAFVVTLDTRADDLRFEQLSTAQGLSDKNVVCILQDSQGFMWFGTDDGLNRYDGYNFSVYKHDPRNPGSIADNRVTALCEDRFGIIWVGTRNGLDRFDRATEAFTHFEESTKTSAGLISKNINALYEDRSGMLWIGSMEGLSSYDHKTSTLTHFRHNPNDPGSLSYSFAWTIYEDASQSVRDSHIFWVGTGTWGTRDGGLNRLDRRSGRVASFKHNPHDPASLKNNWVTSICRDRFGTLWIGTVGGLEKFDEATGKFTHYMSDPKNPRGPSSNNIKSIHEDAVGTLWIGSWDGGLMKLDRATGMFTRYLNDPQDNNSLSSNNVISIYEDKTGTLWIGTSGGVCRLDRAKNFFHSYLHSDRNPRSLQNNDVRLLFQEGSGKILVETIAGLEEFDRQLGVFTPFAPWDPPRSWILALFEDRSGTLWAGTQSGLDRIQRTPYQRTFYDPLLQNLGNPNTVNVCSILEDKNNILWMMIGQSGLCQFDPSTEKFTPCNIGKGRTDLVGNLILEDTMNFPRARGSTLWIGTTEGLWQLNTETNASTQYAHNANSRKSLSSNLVMSLHQDARGAVWVGTDNGLNRFERATGTFERLDETKGLPNIVILGILEDSRGCLWLSTTKGITRYDPEKRRFNTYDVADGLPEIQFGAGCCVRSPTGEMYFGGDKGIVRFHPDSVKDNMYIPPVVITGFRIFGARAQLDTAITRKKTIGLSYQDNVFSFEFAALDYASSDKNQYAYKLEGFDNDWIYCGARRYATYTNLDGGRYIFRVKGSNNDGFWNEEGASIAVIVTPPFWKTWWFRVFGFVAILLSVGGSIRYVEMKKLRRRIEQLENERALERERTRISQDMHDEVGANLTKIAIISELAMKNAGDADGMTAQLQSISQTSREVVDSIGAIVWAINPKNDRLDNLAGYLREYATDYFEVTPIHCRFDFPDEVPSHPLSSVVRRNVFLTVKEAIHNIVKHSAATAVHIRLRLAGLQLEIGIEDNGKGFLMEDISRYGNGLINMRKRIESIDGTFDIQSQPGAGTTIGFIVPVAHGIPL